MFIHSNKNLAAAPHKKMYGCIHKQCSCVRFPRYVFLNTVLTFLSCYLRLLSCLNESVTFISIDVLPTSGLYIHKITVFYEALPWNVLQESVNYKRLLQCLEICGAKCIEINRS